MSDNIRKYYETVQTPWGKLFYGCLWAQLSLSGKTILDFGSGFGLTSEHFAKDNEVVAVEPDREMLSLRFGENYRQVCGGAEQLKDFSSGSFDVIMCHNVLEYVHDRDAILLEFSRLLKKDGVLSVVKHNPNGKIMHKAVFNCDADGAIALLDGGVAVSESFGTIGEYDNKELEEWGGGKFCIERVCGVRHFFGLQRNEVKNQTGWADKMLRLECRVATIPAFRDIAFFHHVILRRSE